MANTEVMSDGDLSDGGPAEFHIPIKGTHPLEANEDTIRLPSEIEKGNIEYKRMLHDLTDSRMDGLATQMNWRINEGYLTNGQHEAVYMLGVEDDGEISGLGASELMDSITSLGKIASRCSAKIKSETIIANKRGMMARVCVERIIEMNAEAFNVFIIGAPNAGKTTLISVIKHGAVDDGKGIMRNRSLQHPHEIREGDTSSIGYHLIGYKADKLVNCNLSNLPWGQIVKLSDRIVTLIDLPGSSDYMHTTMFGLTSHSVDMTLLLIPAMEAGSDLDEYTINYLKWAMTFGKKLIIVITKVDTIGTLDLKSQLLAINAYLLKNYHHKIHIMNKPDDVTQLDSWYKKRQIPTFYISSTDNRNIPLLIQTLGQITPVSKPVTLPGDRIFIITGVYNLPTMGWVVSGWMKSGNVSIGDRMILGQTKSGYVDVEITDIRNMQIKVHTLHMGSYGTLSVDICPADKTDITITKKMVMVSHSMFINFVHKFIISFSSEEDWIKPSSQYNLHTNNQVEPFIVTEIRKGEDGLLVVGTFSRARAYRYISNGDDAIVKHHHRLAFGRIFQLHHMLCD